MDQFWSPATNQRDDDYGGSLDNRLRFTLRVLDAVRTAVGPKFIVGMPAWWPTRTGTKGLAAKRASRSPRRLVRHRQGRFPQHHPRPHRDRRGAGQRHPRPGHGGRRRISTSPARCAPPPSFRSSMPPASTTSPPPAMPIAEGKLDMVGMTRAHIADPHIGRKIAEGREQRNPALRRRHLLPRPHLRRPRGALHP